MSRIRLLIGSLAALALSITGYQIMLRALAERTQGAGLLAAGDPTSALLAAALLLLRLSSLLVFPAAALGAAMWFLLVDVRVIARVQRRWAASRVRR